MSSKSINADVGILGQNQNNDHDSADEKSDVEDKDQGPAIASRLDVYNALENAKFIGSSSFAGKADGTNTIPALPPMSGLFIHDIGRVSLPITPSQAQTLKANSWKTNDDVFTNIYQVEEHSIDIQNPLWDSSISKLIKTVAFKLGIRPDDLSAKLDMLLYMEKGSSIDWCSDVEEDDNIIGSMLIQLPSVFTGGKISVFDGDEEVDEEVDEEDEANFITSFNMGGPNKEAEFACHFVCHYSDCQYEIEEITSGARVLLRYSLCYSSSNDVVSPTANLLHKTEIPLKTSLSLLPRTDRMILVPLRKHYSPSSLILNGIDALAPDHRAIAESIKWAGGNNWTVLILNAHNTYTTRSERDENGQSKISLVTPYDEGGRKVDPKWIVKIIDFNPMEGEDDKKGGRMLLSTSNRLVNNWGKRKSRKTKAIHNGYDSDSHYGYGYDHHTSYEYISTYAATFLLAYDADSVYELKCVEVSKSSISGRIIRNDGVVAAAADVVKKQDYSLLGRLLDVAESKEELRFRSSTCRDLLEVVISTGNKCDGTILANRIIGALSTSAEPDSVLWNTIVSTVKKFGWRDLRANVSSLLFDESRKKESDYTSSRKSRISLVVFLNRIDFCLTLTGADANVRRSNFAQKCISDSIEDLNKTDNKYYLSGSLPEKIDSMIESHGWKAMAIVAKHSLEFLLSNARWRLEIFVCIGRLVSKIHRKHSCSITLEAMTSFAMTFASKMAESSYFDLKNCLSSNPRVEALLACIRVVIEHGDQNAMGLVGKRLVSHRSTFSSFAKTASESAVDSIEPQTFLLDVLNKLLVQQSIDSEVACTCQRGSSCDCKWNEVTPDNVGEDNITVSPSLHIKLTLDASSNLAHMKDKDGRLPLHYAAARGVYETVACIIEANPKAAVIRDPVSGLYPFMLAGSNENTAAAFELLLSDPNLVLGGIPADENDEENDRKRKRSPSM